MYTGAVVRNLTVEGELQAGKYAGGITAVLAGGTIQNCVNRVAITLKEGVTDGYAIGGYWISVQLYR